MTSHSWRQRAARSAALCLLLAAAFPSTTAIAATPASTSSSNHSASHSPQRPLLLVFTRTQGWRHDSIPQAAQALRELADAAGFDIVHSEDPNLFDDHELSRFRVVIFANTTGEILDAAQRAAFERYIAGGGAFMGVHAAADTGKDWPWYGDLVGAWFKSHPPGLQSARVHFESGRGPDGLEHWHVTDELYNYRRNPRPAVEVIATVDESDYEGGSMGADHPIAWCRARTGGRAWYSGLGHAQALYADPVFRAHLLRGLRYATGLSEDC